MIVLGIDPGLSGALAVVEMKDERAVLHDVIDVPTHGEKAKRRVAAAPLLAFLHRYGSPTSTHRVDNAFIERAQAMPDQGASSGFIYGRAVGSLEMAVEGMQIALTVIESTAWKKAHGLMKTSKEDSRQRALRLFPAQASLMARMLDHNRAEAALIAWYGVMLLRGAPIAPPPKVGLSAGKILSSPQGRLAID